MRPSTRIVTLDLGSQSIGLAEFSIRANGPVVLENYRRREILAEPAGEGMRHAQMAVLLREMIGELRNKRGNVNYSVTGQSVFVRFVKLPAVDEEKIERIISFEAQQDVPLPIDQVIWDYQILGGGTDGELQVVLAAIRRFGV
jgi:type IV pilus assembly protein PilM